MADSRVLLRWFVALRVVTGLVFVYMGANHVLGGWASGEVFGQVIGKLSASNPLHWYTAFMVPLVQSQPGVFGPLFTYGMVLTGLGLILGVLTIPALLAGLWLSLNNFLMGFGGGGVHHSVNVVMATVELALLQTGVWRTLSVDAAFLEWWRQRSSPAPQPLGMPD